MSSATAVTASWKPSCFGDGWPDPASAGTASRPTPTAAEAAASILWLRRRSIIRTAPQLPVPGSPRATPSLPAKGLRGGRMSS
jgi:hypothetical protein